MFGILFGTACLFGFIWMWRHPEGHRRWRRGGWLGRHWLRFIFDRLDTSPGQERVMRAAFDDVAERGYATLDALHDARRNLARAFREEELVAERVVEELTRPDDALAELRRTLGARLAELHATLDPEQRARFADSLARSPRGSRGPYRSMC